MELHVYSLLIVFLLSLCLKMSTEFTCEDLHCRNNKCSGDGKCLQGCMDGFVTVKEGKCVVGCTGNCLVCDDGICKTCRSGYFGVRCTQSCVGCKNGSCERTDGKCVNGCRQGFNNPTLCNITHTEYSHSQKQKQTKGEEQMRGLFIWIAGAITLSILSAIGIMIILIVLERNKSLKLNEQATEHLNREEIDAIEIV